MKKFLLVSIFLLLLFLSSCNTSADNSVNSYSELDYNNQDVEAIKEDAILTNGIEFSSNIILPTDVSDPEALKYEDGIHKIVSFDSNVSLYGIYDQNEAGNEMSVLIVWDEIEQKFNWDYLATSGLSLSAYYFDVDCDDEKEIVIDNFIGGGTGVSFSEFHIVKKDDGGKRLVDYKLPSDIVQKVKEQLNMTIEENEVSISISREKLKVPCDNAENISDYISIGNIVEYEASRDNITVIYGIGLTDKEENHIDYIARISASIEFYDGMYLLKDFKLRKYE